MRRLKRQRKKKECRKFSEKYIRHKMLTPPERRTKTTLTMERIRRRSFKQKSRRKKDRLGSQGKKEAEMKKKWINRYHHATGADLHDSDPLMEMYIIQKIGNEEVKKTKKTHIMQMLEEENIDKLTRTEISYYNTRRFFFRAVKKKKSCKKVFFLQPCKKQLRNGRGSGAGGGGGAGPRAIDAGAKKIEMVSIPFHFSNGHVGLVA